MASEQKNTVGKNILTGTVISDKMQKTVVVEVERSFRHPLFNKTVRVKRKFKVHDEQELAKIGDVITFVEGRPVSKTKYMYLDRIVSSSSLGSR
jgi:small subunit ribosomal protein S17